MNAIRIASTTLALALFATTAGAALAQYGPPPPPPPAYGQGPGPGYGQGPGGWDVPPGEYQEFQRRGYMDGIQGARRDFENHRPPSPENRDEFRHPAVPRNVRRDYRDAFRRGYWQAVHHMEGRPGWGPGYGPR